MTHRGRTQGVAGVFKGYTDPRSHFSRRLVAARRAFTRALDASGAGPIVVIDICAGTGYVVLPVIAARPRRPDVVAYLLELDQDSLAIARACVQATGLQDIHVIDADAGLASSYVGVARAHMVVMSGVLRHLRPSDRTRVAAFLPEICAPDALLLWTIGNSVDPTRIARVRRRLAPRWLTPIALERTGTWRHPHEVGLARVNGAPQPLVPDARVFEFRSSLPERVPRLRALLKLVRSAVGR
jgi:SAM-dependent methyltransferase